MTSDIEAVRQSLAPAAYRLLGEDGTIFLQPSWEVLGAAAADLPFDEAHPRAHRSWLGQQCGDWTAVRAAVEAEPNWEARPALHYRLGLARHHLGEPEVAIRLWLPLCWMDPVLFERHAPTIPSTILREEWNAFEGEVSLDEFADTTHAAAGSRLGCSYATRAWSTCSRPTRCWLQASLPEYSAICSCSYVLSPRASAISSFASAERSSSSVRASSATTMDAVGQRRLRL